MKNKNKAQGFTLVELVVVIVTLAILAVVAFSQYVDFRRDGEIARVKTIASALQQSVQFAHTKWLILGSQNEPMNNLPDFAGGELDLNTWGYPIGIDKNNPMGAPKNIGKGEQGCVSLWETLLTDPPSVSKSNINNDSEFQAYRHSSAVASDGLHQCSYVLRTLGDTQGYQDAEIVINYNSITGTAVTRIN